MVKASLDKEQPQVKVPQFNLNSVLSLIVCGAIAYVGNSVTKLNESVARLQAARDGDARILAELMPKPEIMLRFSVAEKDILELRTRITAMEIEVNKLRK